MEQIIIAVIFFYFFMKAGNEPLLWIHTLKIKQNIGFIYGIIILFILVATSNAVNITDGLDGLATGLSIIAFITISIITYNTEWLEGYKERERAGKEYYFIFSKNGVDKKPVPKRQL